MPGHVFTPFAAVSTSCQDNSITLNSPSKSFNIAGLQTANIICKNAEWRRKINRAVNINEVCDVNPFGPIALEAAYNHGEEWLQQLNGYIWENYLTLKTFIKDNLPALNVLRMEGTYLPWIDITATSLTSDELTRRLLSEAKVKVNSGTMYGSTSGEGYIRLNIACPRAQLTEALQRMAPIIQSAVNHTP
jgi:cystathionine beta-lyase